MSQAPASAEAVAGSGAQGLEQDRTLPMDRSTRFAVYGTRDTGEAPAE
jgi:hypothetical protein